MLTKLFNCPFCEEPFDCHAGEARIPVNSTTFGTIGCQMCDDDSTESRPQRGLMEFLDQPAFKRIFVAYEYQMPVNDPRCLGCKNAITGPNGWLAVPAECGHYLCGRCEERRLDKETLFCHQCSISVYGTATHAADAALALFSQILARDAYIQEAQSQLDAKKSVLRTKWEAERALIKAKSGQKKQTVVAGSVFWSCADCRSERPVERLYKCQNCVSIHCGDCSFDYHREHLVDKLLGVELDKLEKENDKKYTDIVKGLDGILQYVQKNVNEAVLMVLDAGKKRLAQVKACKRYDEAQNIVSAIDKAAEGFERRCEVYIPVARELATGLAELGEELLPNRSTMP